MPKATFNPEPQRFDLKTCAEGYVLLQRLPYGKWLNRQQMALQMKFSADKSSGDMSGEMAMANRKVTEFEFRECIVEHNLVGENDEPLNFKNGITLDLLDPRVGNEIAAYISDLHEFAESLPN